MDCDLNDLSRNRPDGALVRLGLLDHNVDPFISHTPASCSGSDDGELLFASINKLLGDDGIDLLEALTFHRPGNGEGGPHGGHPGTLGLQPLTPEPTPNATPEHSSFCGQLLEPSQACPRLRVYRELSLFDSPPPSDGEDPAQPPWNWCLDFFSTVPELQEDSITGRARQQHGDLRSKACARKSLNESSPGEEKQAAKRRRMAPEESPWNPWEESLETYLDDDFLAMFADDCEDNRFLDFAAVTSPPEEVDVPVTKRKVGRPRKVPRPLSTVTTEALEHAAIDHDHDYCKKPPESSTEGPASTEGRADASTSTTIMTSTNPSSATSPAARPTRPGCLVGKDKKAQPQPAKGAQSKTAKRTQRDPTKGEKHRLAEKLRRQIHRQLLLRLAAVLQTVQPQCFAEVHNRKSEKNTLTVALRVLESQQRLFAATARALSRQLQELHHFLCQRLRASPRDRKLLKDYKDVGDLIEQVRIRTGASVTASPLREIQLQTK